MTLILSECAKAMARVDFAGNGKAHDAPIGMTADTYAEDSWRGYTDLAQAAIAIVMEKAAEVARDDALILSDSRKPGSFGRTRKDHGELIANALLALSNQDSEL